MTTAEEIPSVKTAVALEARRRKRVFAIFLGLLAIPVAIGLYAVAKAPSETEAVALNVTPIVERNVEENITRRVDQKIEPRVDELVARRAEPVIQQTLDKQLTVHLDRAVIARVQPLERQYRVMATAGDNEHQRTTERVKELEARVATLEKRLAALQNTRIVAPREDIRLHRPIVPVQQPK